MIVSGIRHHPGNRGEAESHRYRSLKHNTTCPFVEKVRNRSAQLGAGHTVVVHGKAAHEEAGPTFSRTAKGRLR
ncbi:MAG: hypothetical protein IPF64_15115 [Flavobacteriales bacterium]|nr:hypothetical protein [Flavobacteriales bacterium]